MKYRLSLDLGVGSIGSAVALLDEQNNVKNIIDAGVRIFEVSEGAEERRTKRSARKNLIRTHQRLKLLAQKLYENNLWVNDKSEGTPHLLTKSPYKIRKDALDNKLNNPNYIGRALLHLAKHRGAGFVSAAEETPEDFSEDDSKKKHSSYALMADLLEKENCRTIGEFFQNRLQDKDKSKHVIRQKEYALKNHTVDYAIPRYLVKDEFNQIWDKQAEYFKQMQKDGLKEEIYNILFYEKPAAPYAIGKCIYFQDEDRLLKAHPLSEQRRIYEEVNNIRIFNDVTKLKEKLTLEQRDKIINALTNNSNGTNIGKKKIKEILGLTPQQKISLLDDKAIKPYLYSCPEFDIPYIKNLSFNELCDFVSFIANPINPNDKSGRLYSEDELIQRVKSRLKIDNDKVVGELLAKLPKGRSMLGETATKIILEELKKEVISHREVTDKLKKTDQHFEAEEELARQNQGKYFELPYYGKVLTNDTQAISPLIKKYKLKLADKLSGKEKQSLLDEINYGKIANPAVHMILNQIRLVVNEIIKIYNGRPYDINIEVGRDVGLSTKKKTLLENKQKKNKNRNEAVIKELKKRKIPINRDNILKYKLAEDQGWIDAYNPNTQIGQTNFTDFEIEHIIPRAKGGSDTYANLCLVSANEENRAKGDMFAYEYFEQTKKPEEIREILKNVQAHTPEKAWRFEPDAREKFEDVGDEDETNRYLTDTRYVAKMAMRYLRAVVDCNDGNEVSKNRILAVKGANTAELRKIWNLQGLEYDLMGLDVPRYIDCKPYWMEQKTGTIIDGIEKPDIDGNWKFYNKNKNLQWKSKPRIDHRHHAMDAITLACVNRSLVQQMANEENYSKHNKISLPMTDIASLDEFRKTVLQILRNTRVSHKSEHSKAGELHEATGQAMLCQNPDDKNSLITVHSRKILSAIKKREDLHKLLIPQSIKDEWYKDIAEDKKKQQKLVDDFELYMNTAEQILIAENEKGIAEGKKDLPITDGRIIAKAFQIIKEKGLWKFDTFKEYQNVSAVIYIPKHKIAYKSGNNYCVDFFEKDGKIGWEVIKQFDVNQKDFTPQWQKDGGKILWSLHKGDLIELDTPEEWQNYTDKERCLAAVRKFSDSKIGIVIISDARATSISKESPQYMKIHMLDDRGLSFLTSRHCRKIELTPFGKMKKKHKTLWNGKKAKD